MPVLTEELVFSVFAMVVAVIGLLVEHFKFQAGLQERIKALEVNTLDVKDTRKDIGEIKERLKANEVKMELFWGAIEKQVADILKHPTEKRMDDLLDKLTTKTITLKELEDLKEILKCNVEKKGKKSGEVLAAALLIGRVEQLLYDVTHAVPKTL